MVGNIQRIAAAPFTSCFHVPAPNSGDPSLLSLDAFGCEGHRARFPRRMTRRGDSRRRHPYSRYPMKEIRGCRFCQSLREVSTRKIRFWDRVQDLFIPGRPPSRTHCRPHHGAIGFPLFPSGIFTILLCGKNGFLSPVTFCLCPHLSVAPEIDRSGCHALSPGFYRRRPGALAGDEANRRSGTPGHSQCADSQGAQGSN